jgi:hypothetical protein
VSGLAGVDKDFHYTLTDYSYHEPAFVKKVNIALLIFLLVLAYRFYHFYLNDLVDYSFLLVGGTIENIKWNKKIWLIRHSMKT